MSNTEKGKIEKGRRECEEARVWKDQKEGEMPNWQNRS